MQSPKYKRRKHTSIVILESQRQKSSASDNDKNPPLLRLSQHVSTTTIPSSNDDAPIELLRCSSSGKSFAPNDAHISDSSDTNSVDIPNAQQDKYNPNEHVLDTNNSCINSSETIDINNGNNSEEVLMEYRFSATQETSSQMSEHMNLPKLSTNGSYLLVANSLRLSTV